MKKTNEPVITGFTDLAKQLDFEFSKRQAEIETHMAELKKLTDLFRQEKADFEAIKQELLKEKSEFDSRKLEVEAKLAKIRSDQELTKALNEQAAREKNIIELSNKATNDLADAKLMREDLMKRELALSEKEQNFEQEIKLELVNSFVGGRK